MSTHMVTFINDDMLMDGEAPIHYGPFDLDTARKVLLFFVTYTETRDSFKLLPANGKLESMAPDLLKHYESWDADRQEDMKLPFVEVATSGSVNWCWPPYDQPDTCWYTMSRWSGHMLDLLDKATGGDGQPTHARKLELMTEFGWRTQQIERITHVRP